MFKNVKFDSSRFRWSIWGALFGVCFPIMAITIRIGQLGVNEAITVAGQDPLLWIIFTAPIFLGVFACIGGLQNDKVRDFTLDLEKRVEERTRELKQATEELKSQSENQKSLLSGLSEGVFYFDKEGKIAEEKSPALNVILEGANNCENIHEFLRKYSGISASEVQSIIDILWDDSGFHSPFDETVKMLKNKLEIKQNHEKRTIYLHYRPLYDNFENLEKIVVFVEDVTDAIQAERMQRIQSERIKRISMAASNPIFFNDFYEEAVRLFRAIDESLKVKIDL